MSVEIRQKDFANFARELQTVKTCPAFIRARYPFKLVVTKLSSQLVSFKIFAFWEKFRKKTKALMNLSFSKLGYTWQVSLVHRCVLCTFSIDKNR